MNPVPIRVEVAVLLRVSTHLQCDVSLRTILHISAACSDRVGIQGSRYLLGLTLIGCVMSEHSIRAGQLAHCRLVGARAAWSLFGTGLTVDVVPCFGGHAVGATI